MEIFNGKKKEQIKTAHSWVQLNHENRRLCGCGALFKGDIELRQSLAEEMNLLVYLGDPHFQPFKVELIGYKAANIIFVCDHAAEHQFTDGDEVLKDGYGWNQFLCSICGGLLKRTKVIPRRKFGNSFEWR